MSPYNQDNISISFRFMSIQPDHTYSFNETNYSYYPRVYGFESSVYESRSFGIFYFYFPSSQFLLEVHHLQNIGIQLMNKQWEEIKKFICGLFVIMLNLDGIPNICHGTNILQI